MLTHRALQFGCKIAECILLTYLYIGAIFACHGWVKNQKCSWSHLWHISNHQLFKALLTSFSLAFILIIGLLALLIPGFFLAGALFCTFPILMIEDCSIRQATKKSFTVTKGFRFKLFLLGVIIPMLQMIISLVLSFIASRFFINFENHFIYSTNFLNIFLWPLLPFSQTLVYHQLKTQVQTQEAVP